MTAPPPPFDGQTVEEPTGLDDSNVAVAVLAQRSGHKRQPATLLIMRQGEGLAWSAFASVALPWLGRVLSVRE